MKANTTPRSVLTGLSLGLVLLVSGASAPHAAETQKAAAVPPPPASVKQEWGVLDKFCVKCHNFTDWAGKVAFDTMTPDQIPDNAEIFEAAIRKLHGGLMPPPGNPRPPEKTVNAFAGALANYLDETAAASGPQPGHVSLHRLNRKEYANAVRDLLDVKIEGAAYLPPDTESDGFDNIANVLKVSPTFIDQYLAAARDISIRAVGDSADKPTRALYVAPDEDQSLHIHGLPLGTRGGMQVTHYFPADGEYEFNISGLVGARYTYGVDSPQTLVLLIDDKKVFQNTLGGPADQKAVDQQQAAAVEKIRNRFKNIRVKVSAGEHRIAATFIARAMAESDDTLQPLDPVRQDPGGDTGAMDKLARVKDLEILGPYDVTGQTETASQKKIFICHPESASEERPCAKKIFSHIARLAFARPVTDDDMAELLKFYDAGHKSGGFREGVQKGIMAILATPKFLYRGVRAPDTAAPGSIYHLSNLELAARLSFFLWSSVPDDELMDTALHEDLHDPKVLAREVHRMLKDPRSKSLVTSFGFQWLQVNKLDTLEKRNPDRYPDFDEALVGDFRQEMNMFLDSVLRGNKSIVDLLTADYTFVNERLAGFYGIPGVNGDKFRRVHLTDSHRWGLLGKGAVLIVSSYPHRTSPVLRGQWLLENVIGAPPSAPPAGVNTNLDADPTATTATTVRERLAAHRTEKSCNMCHGVLDPLGLALENFNAIGQWREKDRYTDTPINASGQLATGQKLNGPDDLRRALSTNPRQFVETFTEKLMSYALGRTVEYYDMPVIRRILANAKNDDYRFSSIVMGIVTSAPFEMEQVPAGRKKSTQEASLAQ